MSEYRTEDDRQGSGVRITEVPTQALVAPTAEFPVDRPKVPAAWGLVADDEVPVLFHETLATPQFEGLEQRDGEAVATLTTEPEPWNLYDNSVTALIDTLARGIPTERVREIKASVDAEWLLSQALNAADELNEADGGEGACK